jgi:glycosyltransferase involved in cell wall biosynthesis
MRVAVVHDWLYVRGGAERVLGAILKLFPEADLFTLFDTLDATDRLGIGYVRSNTSFMQRLPWIRRNHRLYLPLMPLAIEQFDLRSYDLVISSSYAVAKGVITGPDQLHISYVHSPMRYAWDLQHQYLAESRMGSGVRGALARLVLAGMRIWDGRTANGVDAYVVNSRFVGRRVRKIYGREATVIYPPVDVPRDLPIYSRGDHFFTASRFVPYKQVAAIVSAFRHLPDCRLIVAGTGPERERIAALAGPNVEMRGFVDDEELRRLMGGARAFVFAAEEDFGIVPVEAQGQGTPVIALGRGGALETVVTTGERRTGVFFDRPDPLAIADAVRRFNRSEASFSARACHENALRFSQARFEREFSAFVRERQADFAAELLASRAPPLPDLAPAQRRMERVR